MYKYKLIKKIPWFRGRVWDIFTLNEWRPSYIVYADFMKNIEDVIYEEDITSEYFECINIAWLAEYKRTEQIKKDIYMIMHRDFSDIEWWLDENVEDFYNEIEKYINKHYTTF